MKPLKSLLQHDAFKYLVAGVITTIFYIVARAALFYVSQQALLSTALANASAIILAFVLNDIWVFTQQRSGWPQRFVKFFVARLSSLGIDILLTFIFVQTFPHIIGQFVHNNLNTVDAIVSLIGQVIIVVLNYFLSKFLIFKD